MAPDIQFTIFLAISVIFLFLLVWLMYKEGSKSAWKETSRQTREKRNKNETS